MTRQTLESLFDTYEKVIIDTNVFFRPLDLVKNEVSEQSLSLDYDFESSFEFYEFMLSRKNQLLTLNCIILELQGIKESYCSTIFPYLVSSSELEFKKRLVKLQSMYSQVKKTLKKLPTPSRDISQLIFDDLKNDFDLLSLYQDQVMKGKSVCLITADNDIKELRNSTSFLGSDKLPIYMPNYFRCDLPYYFTLT